MKKYNLLANTLKSIGILSAATLLSLIFESLQFTKENIIMVYILGVLLISVVTSHIVYSLVYSIISVFVFNYFFTPPRFSLAYETGYPVTFIVMFLTAFITSTFALRYKEQAKQIARDAKEKEEAAVLVESERLRANLLRAISHDLRTPLTSISGNAANLLNHEKSFDEETKNQLYSDIYDDSMWLINLVENLLSATRIEDGEMKLRISPEVVDDIIDEAMKHIDRRASEHNIAVDTGAELLLVNADAKLIVQVIINLVDNAIKYTEKNSDIRVAVRKKDDMAEILVADNGKGIPDEEKEKIFGKFYCGENELADNRRSLGLGLFLCKAIVEAHGGKICATDNEPTGSVFTFTLPLKEVSIYE